MIPAEWVEAATRAGFKSGAEAAAREFGLIKPVAWDDLTERDHDHERKRAQAALAAALPLIRAQIATEVRDALDTHTMTLTESTASAVSRGYRTARAIALGAIRNPKEPR